MVNPDCILFLNGRISLSFDADPRRWLCESLKHIDFILDDSPADALVGPDR